jgi:glycosyl transferase family WbsX
MCVERRTDPRICRHLHRGAPITLCVLAISAASVCWSQGYDHHVAADWNFAKAGATLGWAPISPLTKFGIEKSALTFTATSESVIVYSSSISVPAEPMQLVEVVMSSNTAGPASVFWAPSPSVSSPGAGFTGFQPGDENDFLMVGDGAFHHYYLPIATTAGSTIYRLRMDVPPGATVSIKSVDVANLVAPKGAGVAPDWKFTAADDLLGWIPLNGVVDTAVSGGSLHLQTFSNATILAPNAQVTNNLEWFSLFGSVTQTALETPWVLFNFVSKVNNGSVTQVYFPVVADAVPHVYNSNVGGMNGWWAGESQLSITVSEKTTIAIRQMQISDAPQGPADLAVDAFGPATPLIRAGSSFLVSCRVSDRGAEDVQHLAVKLDLPADGRLKLMSSPTVPATLANGYPQTLTWKLKASESGSFPISVSATGHSGSAQASNVLLVNPAVKAQASTYVPKPVPLKTDYDIGIYYFPGWSHYSHWDPIRNLPERTPALGHYAEGAPQILDWQIKWAVEHGVSFFAADWYWINTGQALSPGERPNNFLEAYSASAYRDYIKFCIAYADDNDSDAAGSDAAFLDIVRAWIKEYFSRPGYYKIDGKPVIFILNPVLLDTNLGGSSQQALDDARKLASDAGFGGIYFVAAALPSQVSQDGYDALSAYNYNAAGTDYNYNPAGTTDPDEAPYTDMVTGYSSIWDSVLATSSVPYFIPTAPGADNRAWATYDTTFEMAYTGSTPELFQQMLQNAKTRIDSGKAPRMLLVEAWNELGEGSYVEPTAGEGFGYLDAIRNVFSGESPHTDLAPSDVGLPLIEVQPSTSLWTFTSADDLSPWQSAEGPPFWEWVQGVSNSRIANNQWSFTSNGYGDLLRMGFELPAPQYSAIAVTLSVSADTWVTIFWGADDEPGPSAIRNAGFNAKAGATQTYTIPVADLPGWRGSINLLRLTFSSPRKVNVALRSIQFIPSSSAKAIAASQTQLEFRATAGSAAPAAQILSVASATLSSLSWTAAAQKASWLELSLAKGAAPGNIAVSVKPKGLAVGVYMGAIEISADGASNSPLKVPVTLWVMPPR